MTYQFDPAMRPDGEFVPGTLALLVAGNAGRMLDPRRTPVRIEALREETGFFVCRVLAFEDEGAQWAIPFEAVDRFQFERESAVTAPDALRRLQETVLRLDRPYEVACDPEQTRATHRALADLVAEAARWSGARSRFFARHARLDGEERTDLSLLWDDLGAWMEERDLLNVEEAVATQYVSHPGAGEMVKGHRIVLAEMGLVPYVGTVVRDALTFAGRLSGDRRRAHVLARLAFVRAAFARGGLSRPVLYRGLSFDAPEPRRSHTFVSATFKREVALALFEPPLNAGTVGVLYRQAVPIERVFMTYLETRQMSERFDEAEAVLFDDPSNAFF